MRCLYCAAILLSVVIAPCVPARAETLEDALAAAYLSNPGLQAQREQLKAVDETVNQARAGWFPTLSATGNSGRGRYFADTSVPYVEDRTPRDYTASISQPIYSGGQTVAAIGQSENSVLATRSQMIAAEQNVLLNAATAYLDVVRDQTMVALATNHVKVLEKEVESTRARYGVHEVTLTDVSQAEARLAQAEADLTQAEGNLQDSQSSYMDVVGHAPELPTAPETVWPVPSTFDDVRTTVMVNNPNIVAADYSVKAAQYGIDAAEGQLLPTVSLNGTVSSQLAESTPGSQTNAKQVMMTVSMPLYDGGATYSKVRAQKNAYSQKLKEAEQARRDAQQSAAKAWQDLRAARARVASYKTQIYSNEVALKGIMEEEKIGLRTVWEVLNAQQELFTSQQNLAAARHDEMVGAFQVASALGQMTASSLSLPVQVYDPVIHYEKVRDKMYGLGSVDGE